LKRDIFRYKGIYYPVIGTSALFESRNNKTTYSKKLGGYSGIWSFLPHIGVKCIVSEKNWRKPYKQRVIDAIDKHEELYITTSYFDDCAQTMDKVDYEADKEHITKMYIVRSRYDPLDKGGSYVGDINFGYSLAQMDLHYIQPAEDTLDICQVGYSHVERKWYGWSHRAMFGFGVGSKVKEGDIGYQPVDAYDWLVIRMKFFDYDSYILINDDGTVQSKEYQEISKAVKVEMWNSKAKRKFVSESDIPTEFGRGEWTAETIDDAKQMAIDFARGVS